MFIFIDVFLYFHKGLRAKLLYKHIILFWITIMIIQVILIKNN